MALRYIADNSASPMETILSMLMTLPYRLGGYNLPMPILNKRLEIPLETRKAVGKSYYECDIYWPQANVDLEYDSDTHHAEKVKIAMDSIRRDTLLAMGVTVITVTSRQINNAMVLHEVAKTVAKLLGKRLQLPDDFEDKRSELRRQLLSGNQLPPEP